METATLAELEGINKLDKDTRAAAATMSDQEARYLVDLYYMMQENRKRAANQLRAMDAEPNQVIEWAATNARSIENGIKSMLGKYAEAHDIGQWSLSVCGIGPVISAGLMAHIDINKAPTVGHIWRFAGLDPTQVWGKGEKRPWNASLKTLCWKIGESFVKVCNNPKDFYGKIYVERKDQEIAKNDAGEFKGQAEAKLEKFKIGKKTDAYKSYSDGKLPPAHIHARACRYAVKLFLSHWHHVAFVAEFGTKPPKPYILTQAGGHAHMIEPPNFSG